MPTIVIVDDNAELVQLYSLILESSGNEVFSAGNGEQCFALLDTITPDLILLDIMMEPMDGWEVLKRLRLNKRIYPVAIFMVSGKKPTPGEIWEFMDMVDDYRIKPLGVKDLKALVVDFIAAQGRLDREIVQLEHAGAGEQVIKEYRGLRRSVTSAAVMTRLLEMSDDKINQCIQSREKRLMELRGEYSVSG